MENVEVYRDYGSVGPMEIGAFEVGVGIKLPKSYKALIRQHNALRPEKSMFRFINRFHNEFWPYRLNSDGTDSRDISFYGFGTHVPDYALIDDAQDFDVFGHDHVIAFGCCANGDHICFDYRHDPATDEPHVVMMFHDGYDDAHKMLISHVANSFDEFLALLYKGE